MANAEIATTRIESDEYHSKWFVLVSLAFGSLMVGLDTSIVNAVLPIMADSLQTSMAHIEWVVTIFLLFVCGMLLAFGRLGDIRGHKTTLLMGFTGFTISSGLCGIAPSAGWLIAFRVLQAIGGATFMSNGPAILTNNFPARQRGQALGLQATITYFGISAGAPLGGLLATHFGWRSIFLVNVPVGIVGTLMAYHYIPNDRPEGEAASFDMLGAFLFFAGLLPLLLALDQGYLWGWTSPLTLGLIVAAAVLLACFIKVEHRPHPMLDLSLFRRRVFAGSTFSSSMAYLAQNSTLFIIPFYLIDGRGLTPERAGFVLAAQPLLMMIFSPFAGILSDRIGSRAPTALGLLVVTVGLIMLSTSGMAAPMSRVVLALGVCGAGFGMFNAPNNSRLLGAAPPDRRGIASGVLAAARNIGLVMGAAISGAIYTTVLSRTGGHGFGQAVSATFLIVAVATAVAIVTSWREGNLAGEP